MDDVTGKPAASELIVDVQFGPTGRVLLPVCREPGVHAHDAPPCVDIPGLRPLWGAGQPKAPGQPRPPPSFMMGAAGWWLPRQAVCAQSAIAGRAPGHLHFGGRVQARCDGVRRPEPEIPHRRGQVLGRAARQPTERVHPAV